MVQFLGHYHPYLYSNICLMMILKYICILVAPTYIASTVQITCTFTESSEALCFGVSGCTQAVLNQIPGSQIILFVILSDREAQLPFNVINRFCCHFLLVVSFISIMTHKFSLRISIDISNSHFVTVSIVFAKCQSSVRTCRTFVSSSFSLVLSTKTTYNFTPALRINPLNPVGW